MMGSNKKLNNEARVKPNGVCLMYEKKDRDSLIWRQNRFSLA
jgi:hypothetical protein